jgi:hypothetical protein
MSDTVKLIIAIPKEMHEALLKTERIISSQRCGKTLMNVIYSAVAKATPLDNNPERAELQAYFDGESFGWDEGREALIDDVKSEIDKAQEPYITNTAYDEGVRFGLMLAYQIVDRYKTESEGTNERD